jgi:hypothetical protein
MKEGFNRVPCDSECSDGGGRSRDTSKCLLDHGGFAFVGAGHRLLRDECYLLEQFVLLLSGQ